MTERLDKLDYLSLGKRVRLHRMMYEHGPGNGTLLLLPIDQGLEHGPIDMFANPASLDVDYIYKLALEGNFSGIALHLGLAEKYAHKYAGKVPIVLKLNGKTNIPSDAKAFSALTGSVEDAVRIGADAVGYTLYVGSPSQDKDFLQLRQIKADCDRYGMPFILWSYPRGEAIEAKGGRDSLYAIDYAARVADELGVDVVKLNVPKVDAERMSQQPKPYDTLEFDYAERVRKVIKSSGKTLVLFSGGSKMGDEDLLEKARICMQEGATGLIWGRNLWQREWDDAMKIIAELQKMMKSV